MRKGGGGDGDEGRRGSGEDALMLRMVSVAAGLRVGLFNLCLHLGCGWYREEFRRGWLRAGLLLAREYVFLTLINKVGSGVDFYGDGG